MGLFRKIVEEVQGISDDIKSIVEETTTQESSSTPEPEEEWIWVEGYKGTDKDMKCLDFQYTLGAQYDMPEEDIKECTSGFHLCLKLDDVFSYYDVGKANRFFKVKALVRKSDVDQYGIMEYCYSQVHRRNKLVAKSIIFISELTQDEILKDTVVESLDQKYKDLAIECDIVSAKNLYNRDVLMEDGYSEAFANYVITQCLFDKAHAVGSMKGVSMDMRVLFILQAK